MFTYGAIDIADNKQYIIVIILYINVYYYDIVK